MYLCTFLQDSMDSTAVDDSSRVLSFKDLKKGGVTRIMYTHSSCPGLTCSLTCTSLGPYIMVHGMSFCACWLYVLFWQLSGGVIHKRCDYPIVNELNFRLLRLAGVCVGFMGQKWVSLQRATVHEAGMGTIYQAQYFTTF